MGRFKIRSKETIIVNRLQSVKYYDVNIMKNIINITDEETSFVFDQDTAYEDLVVDYVVSSELVADSSNDCLRTKNFSEKILNIFYNYINLILLVVLRPSRSV